MTGSTGAITSSSPPSSSQTFTVSHRRAGMAGETTTITLTDLVYSATIGPLIFDAAALERIHAPRRRRATRRR